MSDSKTETKVAVVGSTGYIGSATVGALASKFSSVPTIAFARNPEGDKAKGLAASNVTVAKGSFGDSGLADSLAGVSSVVLVTPGAEDRAPLTNTSIDACKAAGVKHVVLVSVAAVTAEKDHLFKRQFAEIEQHLVDSGLPHTIVRLPMFLDNQWGNAATIKGQNTLYHNLPEDKKYTVIGVADSGEALATIAVNPADHVGKAYTLTTPVASSNADFVAAYTKSLGREIKYVQVPDQGVHDALIGLGMPEWQVGGVMELIELMAEDCPQLCEPTGDFKTIVGRDATTIEAWVESVKGGFA